MEDGGRLHRKTSPATTLCPQMLRSDAAYVKRFLAEAAVIEAAGAGGDEPAIEAAGAGGDQLAVGAGGADGGVGGEVALGEPTAEVAPLLGSKGLVGAGSGGGLTETAILPWWLPPEDVPPQYSGERNLGWLRGACGCLCLPGC